MTKEDQAYFQSLMNDVEAQFVAVVEKERGLKHRQVVRIADGRVFTGEQAVQMHLVDTIGTYEDAIAITAKLAGIRGEPSLVRERTRGLSLFERVFGQAKIPDFLGLGSDLMNRPIMQYRVPYGN
jgi:protease-4